MAESKNDDRKSSDYVPSIEDTHCENSNSSLGAGLKQPNCFKNYFPRGYNAEFLHSWKLAWPLVLVQFLQMLTGPVMLAFAGRLGKVEFDAATLAYSIINVTVVTSGYGMATACDTIFSQTFGYGKKNQLGDCLQRSLILITLVAFPVIAIHVNLERILILIGQDAEISHYAEQFVWIFIPGTLSFYGYLSLVKFVFIQNIVIPNLIIIIIVNLLNAALNYLFSEVLGLGLSGCALGYSLSFVCMLVMTLVYIIQWRVYKTYWNGWNLNCLYNWGYFAKLVFYGFLMICIEYWTFEATILIAGSLGPTELGAQSIIYNIESLWFQIPFGASIAASILIGQHLGSGEAELARAKFLTFLSATLVVAAIASVIFATCSDLIPLIFTNDVDIASLASSIIPIISIFTFADTLCAVSMGVLRGCGRQRLGTVIMGIGYAGALGIGIPIIYTTDWGIIVLWVSLLCTITPIGIVTTLICWKLDWKQEVKNAADLVDKANQEAGEKEPLLHQNNNENESPYSDGNGISCQLICKRLLIVTLFLILLLIGLIIRFLVPCEACFDPHDDVITENMTNVSTMEPLL